VEQQLHKSRHSHMLCNSYILAIRVNVGRNLRHTTVRYRTFATYSQNEYTGEAGTVSWERRTKVSYKIEAHTFRYERCLYYTTTAQLNKLPLSIILFRIIDCTMRFNNRKIQTHAFDSQCYTCVRRDGI